METKHTAGDWFVATSKINPKKHSHTVLSFVNGATAICDVYTRNIKKLGKGSAKANAKIIAAAPELLMALQMAEGKLSKYYQTNHESELREVLQSIRNTIKKAVE